MLSIDRFPEFFGEFNAKMNPGSPRRSPFPWQKTMAKRIFDGSIPWCLDLPTSSGKTFILISWLFALACSDKKKAGDRKVAMRIFYTVDRRNVIDDTYMKLALPLEKILEESLDDKGILGEVAQVLMSFGGNKPIICSIMRGATSIDERWVTSPLQPSIVITTIDQLGSRMLFSGYGVSDHAKPVHAALTCNDALIVLDEAHCSEPFMRTLFDIQKLRLKAEVNLGLPFDVASMTATPPSADELGLDQNGMFRLSNEDLENPVLAKRINAKKLCTLVLTEETLYKTIANTACDNTLIGQSCLVVSNRVKGGRIVAKEIKKIDKKAEVVLITGMTRPYSRDLMMSNPEIRKLIDSGRDRAAMTGKRLFLVASPCVEVGSDYDFDVCVTEICALNALMQRMGRNNRLGILETSKVYVVAHKNQVEPENKDKPCYDAVYGQALAATWHWLREQENQHGFLDLGIKGFSNMLPQDASERDVLIKKLVKRPAPPPLLFTSHCDMMVQTSPRTSPSFDPSTYLHGPQPGDVDVMVVWRSDLGDDSSKWAQIVSLCSPVSSESLSMTVSSARSWLSGLPTNIDDSDIEGTGENLNKFFTDDKKKIRQCLIWKGKDSEIVDPEGICPGDTIVVPSTYGGCDEWGWTGKGDSEVEDLAEEARHRSSRRPIIRVHSSVEPKFKHHEEVWSILRGLSSDADECQNSMADVVKILKGDKKLEWLSDTAKAIMLRGCTVSEHPSGDGMVITASQERQANTQACKDVFLDDHSEDVKNRSLCVSQYLFSDSCIIEAIGAAGGGHDWGKLDFRMQAWLRNGNIMLAMARKAIARGAGSLPSKEKREAARAISGYPSGERHEIMSAELVKQAYADSTLDKELITHLVASSHGRCRPYAPIVDDHDAPMVMIEHNGKKLSASYPSDSQSVASQGALTFHRLNRRYGWWGLAFLEAIVRLADQETSKTED